MRKLTKTEKVCLIEASQCSSMSTPRWRDYVPLSNLGLVDIDGEHEGMWVAAFGVSYKRIEITERGKAVADDLLREANLWQPLAAQHANRDWCERNRMVKPDGTLRKCTCWACIAAYKMRPVAA